MWAINQQQVDLRKMQIMTLIFEFWLSGLWILSLIFTTPDVQHLEKINFYMFITLGIGSFVGGYASDVFSRLNVFKSATLVWVIGSVVTLLNYQIGYVISAGSIGLLNNLTFVIIMERFPTSKDAYTIYVLIGWAVSQITLGSLFYLISIQNFFILLLILTVIFAFLVLTFFQDQIGPNNQQPNNESLIQNETIAQNQNINQQNCSECVKKLMPHSIKALIGGCLLMFVMQMFYYRTQFTLDRFGISLQLNTIIVGLTQLTANIIFTKFINRFPRKLYLRIFLIILSLLFLVLIVTNNKVVQTLVEGVMRLFDTCIMIILGVYIPELFQKNQRGKGTNYVMSFGVLGSALNALILNNFKFWQLIFFLFLAFLTTFCFRQSLQSQKSQQNNKIQNNN